LVLKRGLMLLKHLLVNLDITLNHLIATEILGYGVVVYLVGPTVTWAATARFFVLCNFLAYFPYI